MRRWQVSIGTGPVVIPVTVTLAVSTSESGIPGPSVWRWPNAPPASAPQGRQPLTLRRQMLHGLTGAASVQRVQLLQIEDGYLIIGSRQTSSLCPVTDRGGDIKVCLVLFLAIPDSDAVAWVRQQIQVRFDER